MESSGGNTCSMYIADLVSMRNMEKTEMTRLKLVMLAKLDVFAEQNSRKKNDEYEQLTPYFGRCERSVIGSGVDGGVGTGVEAICSTISPEFGAVQIGSGDSKQSEKCDRQGKFEGNEGPKRPFIRTVFL
jgi:hypothetical protein